MASIGNSDDATISSDGMASIGNSDDGTISSDGESSCTTEVRLAMLSGSFYISKDRAKLQGEDAHFFNMEMQTVGVADGVGGWGQYGIDSGEYARQLMENAEMALQNQPTDNVDPRKILEEAYAQTDAHGSSTACILALVDKELRVVNIGDSGFMLIREGEVVYRSPVQQYFFNCPFQLAHGQTTGTPAKANAFSIIVEEGDIIITGTDGLFDNLFETQIAEVAKVRTDIGMDPEAVAWAIAEHAYYTSLDADAFTPFMASWETTKENDSPYQGGKPDDITVVVSCIVGA